LTAQLKRPEVHMAQLLDAAPALGEIDRFALEQAEIDVKYAGYLGRQQSQIDAFRRAEFLVLPEGIDYLAIDALRIEARQKLDKQRPRSLGQASRIPGVSPGDIQVLLIYLGKR
ncbi:MAG: tRNA uridine-5-carboxymethylaminomethyl(34) synthesis enzyme MnmG, partial [Clostridia bacterium]